MNKSINYPRELKLVLQRLIGGMPLKFTAVWAPDPYG
jgi:hypothetical protein